MEKEENVRRRNISNISSFVMRLLFLFPLTKWVMARVTKFWYIFHVYVGVKLFFIPRDLIDEMSSTRYIMCRSGGDTLWPLIGQFWHLSASHWSDKLWAKDRLGKVPHVDNQVGCNVQNLTQKRGHGSHIFKETEAIATRNQRVSPSPCPSPQVLPKSE